MEDQFIVVFTKVVNIKCAASLPLSHVALRQPTGDASVRMYFTDRELFKSRKTHAECLSEIQQFALTDLLLFTTKIALALERDNGLLSRSFQLKLAEDLLSREDAQRYKTIIAFHNILARASSRKLEITPIVTPLQTLNFMKRVILSHKDRGTRPIHLTLSPGSHQDAFRLLLQVGNILGNSSHSSTIGEVISELIRSSIFFHREAPDVLISRFHKLFFDLPKTHPPTDHPNETIEELFKNATQVSLENYFALGIGLIGKFVQASLLRYDPNQTPDPNEHCILHWPEWLSTVKIDSAQVRLMKNIFCSTIDDIKRALKTANPMAVFEYDLLPFINNPLLEVESDTYLVSYFPFLVEKFTAGIYWLIFDSLSGSSKGRFQKYWGFLCQQYVEEIFRTDIVPFARRKMAFYDLPYQSSGSDAFSSDIIIFDEKSSELFLFEVTYSALRLETSFRQDNLVAFSEGIDKIVGKIRQVDTVIKDLRTGTLKLPDVDVSKIKTYRPFIITMTPYPIWNFVWQSHLPEWTGLLQRINERQLLQAQDISEVKIINAREIEILGALQRSRIDIFALISDWPKDRRWSNEPLQNFLIDRHPRKGNFTTLKEQYLRATALAQSIL